MQADRFTIKSQEAVAAAQRLAAERRNPEVAPRTCCSRCSSRRTASRPRCCASSPPTSPRSPSAPATRSPSCRRSAATTSPTPRLAQSFIEVLQRAEKEMAALGDEYISIEHLLLALADKAARRRRPAPRPRLAGEAIAEIRGPHRVTSPNPEEMAEALEKFGRDLTADARAGKLDPVIGRDEEIRRVIQVLSRRTKNNPVLIGEPGRRQDRDRRGPRAADRRRRRARVAARPARDRARHRRPARRLEVPRRVRGAAQGRAQGGPGRPRARSSSSSTSCTRSSAPAPPRARSTPPTC